MAKLNEQTKKLKQNKAISAPLFKLERKNNLSALVIFGIITILLLVVIIALFPTLKESMAKMLETMDPAMQDIFGKLAGINSVTEYFTMQGAQIWGLLSVIYASYLSYKLMVSDFKNGNAEMLYTSNLSRGKILRTKLLRLAINTIILNLACAIVSFVGLMILDAGSVNVGLFMAYTLFIIILSLQVGIFVFSLACIFKTKFNMFLTFALPLIFFFIGSIALIDKSVEMLNYLSPFAVAYSSLMTNGFSAVPWGSFVVWTIIPAILFGYSYYKFKNSDLLC